MSCNKCGKCCKEVAFFVNKERFDIDWIQLHGFEVEDQGDKYKIKKQSICSKLVENKCSIYETRPEMCRNFNCIDSVLRDFPELKE